VWCAFWKHLRPVTCYDIPGSGGGAGFHCCQLSPVPFSLLVNIKSIYPSFFESIIICSATTSIFSIEDVKPEVINTTEQIGDLVYLLIFGHARPALSSPAMYIDLEGVNLCREGSVSILTLLIDTGTSTSVYLIDVHTLGAQAFNVAGARRKTLKDILQDETIPKVFFDVRNDSDALFAHFGVALQGVEDVQLMESATRTTTASRKYLNGLAKFIENNMFMSIGGSGLASWKLAKAKGERLFKAEHGGSFDVFNQRPIPEDIISYCVGDVQYLPGLRDRFWTGQDFRWRDLVREESKNRVAASQRPDYQPHGRDKPIASWSKEQNTILDQWNYVSPPRNSFDDFFDLHDNDDDDDDDDDYDEDDGYNESCRDIISDCDYGYYYSD
jgi:exonuclease 3'-5' domain-containing protein 1